MSHDEQQLTNLVGTAILKRTEPNAAGNDHLDENDLALLELNGMSEEEASDAFEHLAHCHACRKLVSQLLRSQRMHSIISIAPLAERLADADGPQRSNLDTNEPAI